MLNLIAQLAQTAPDISQSAPWVTNGLLGAVLSWLLFVHLPSKDSQLKDLLDSHSEDRREWGDRLMQILAESKEQSQAHREALSNALREQTRELQAAIKGICHGAGN